MARKTAAEIRAAIRRNARKIKVRIARRDRAKVTLAKLRKWNATWRRRLARLTQPKVPGISAGWHPNAQRVPYSAPGTLDRSVPAKLVWHTTETAGLPRYSGSAPHITFDVKTGRIYQHIALHNMAAALKHPTWPETNRANAIQVELIGYSDARVAASIGRSDLAVQNWTDADYARIASLARWIEKHAGVKRVCTVKFENRSHPLSGDTWLRYGGHLGHQHVPNNDHWDPSGWFKIEKVV